MNYGSRIIPLALVSFVAVLSGCITAAVYDVAPAVIALNLAAWGIGLIAALLVRRVPPRAAQGIVLIASLVLALTLNSKGLSGVHRWIELGLNFNAALLLLPLVLAALASLTARSPLRLIVPAIIMLILTAQPDASQAAAFAAGAVIVVIASERSMATRAITVFGLFTLAIIAAFRPDPLLPVPEVEGILVLAAQRSVLLAAIAVLSLAGVAVLLAMQARAATPHRWTAASLALYFCACALAPLFGPYPVPLIGMGISPILGLWLGIGWLQTQRATSPSP